VQDVNFRASDRSQKPRIVSELFIDSPPTKYVPCGGAQTTQRLGRLRSIDCRAIVQIARDEHGIRLLPSFTFATIRRKKPPFLTCPKMQVADERSFAPAPGFRQVLQPDRNSPNSRQTRVEDAKNAAQQSRPEKHFHDPVEVRVPSRQQRDPEEIQDKAAAKNRKLTSPSHTAATR